MRGFFISMIFTLIITSAPHQASAHHALMLCEALLKQSHHLPAVMFVGPAVLHAAPTSPNHQRWRQLALDEKIALNCCTNSVEKHALTKDLWPCDYQQNPFQLSGLGQLAFSVARADRTLTFGESAIDDRSACAGDDEALGAR